MRGTQPQAAAVDDLDAADVTIRSRKNAIGVGIGASGGQGHVAPIVNMDGAAVIRGRSNAIGIAEVVAATGGQGDIAAVPYADGAIGTFGRGIDPAGQ